MSALLVRIKTRIGHGTPALPNSSKNRYIS